MEGCTLTFYPRKRLRGNSDHELDRRSETVLRLDRRFLAARRRTAQSPTSLTSGRTSNLRKRTRRLRTGDGACRGSGWTWCDVDHVAVDDVGDGVAVAMTSMRFHSPAAAPRRLPRKPRTSFQAGSRPHQLNRPESRVSGSPPSRNRVCRSRAARLAGQAGAWQAGDHDEVAAAALDDLALLRLHPVPAAAPSGPTQWSRKPESRARLSTRGPTFARPTSTPATGG